MGPRCVGTEGAEEGARRIRALLEEEGLEVFEDTFRAPRHTLYDGPSLIALILLALAAAAYFGPPTFAVPSAFFMALALIPLVGELLAEGVNLDLFLPKTSARSIGAAVAGKGAGEVVLVAHMDTQWASFLFAPAFIPFTRLYFILAYIGFFGLLCVSAAYGLWHLPWAHSAIPSLAALLFVTMAVLRLAAAGLRPLEGANDNASGVAVAAAVALRIRQDVEEGRLAEDGARLTLLLTGAEEVGERGMLHWLRRTKPSRRDTVFVNLDNVGGGTLRYLEAEGMVVPLRSHPSLLRLAREVARTHPDELLKGEPLLLPTDAMWPIAMGYAAITFIGQEAGGVIPDYHQTTDRLERLDPDHLEKVADIVHAYVAALWSEATETAASPEV